MRAFYQERGDLRGKRQRVITSKSVRHPCVCKHRGTACKELDQNGKCPHHCASFLSASIEEDLGCREPGGRVQDAIEISQAEAHGHGQKPAKDSRHQDSCLDGNWSSDSSVVGLLGHAEGIKCISKPSQARPRKMRAYLLRCAIVIRHSPRDRQESKEE